MPGPHGNLTKVSPVRDDEPLLPVLQPCREGYGRVDRCVHSWVLRATPLSTVASEGPHAWLRGHCPALVRAACRGPWTPPERHHTHAGAPGASPPARMSRPGTAQGPVMPWQFQRLWAAQRLLCRASAVSSQRAGPASGRPTFLLILLCLFKQARQVDDHTIACNTGHGVVTVNISGGIGRLQGPTTPVPRPG